MTGEDGFFPGRFCRRRVAAPTRAAPPGGTISHHDGFTHKSCHHTHSQKTVCRKPSELLVFNAHTQPSIFVSLLDLSLFLCCRYRFHAFRSPRHGRCSLRGKFLQMRLRTYLPKCLLICDTVSQVQTCGTHGGGTQHSVPSHAPRANNCCIGTDNPKCPSTHTHTHAWKHLHTYKCRR